MPTTRRPTIAVSCALIACIVLGGCGHASSRDDGNAADGLTSRRDDDKKPVPVAVQLIDGPAFQKAVARHRGKVVLVDFWATWCGPCREGFPHVVELHRRYADRGLAVIAVSMDKLKDKPQVEKVLGEYGAAFECLLSRYDGMGSEVAEVFGFSALPHYQLYDRQGKLVKSFASGDSPIDPQEIDRAVEELLK
jgi:thiol-disulfide isomerase/thioredoxin